GVISSRLRPNSLFVAFEIGALINASVSKLAAVPNPDCARTDVPVSVALKVPVRISDTTSACGKAGSELTFDDGWESGPFSRAVTRETRRLSNWAVYANLNSPPSSIEVCGR